MIILTNLRGTEFVLNCDLIEMVTSNPDTTITLDCALDDLFFAFPHNRVQAQYFPIPSGRITGRVSSV